MNLPTWYSTGNVSVESGGTTVAGTGSLWGTGGVDDNIMIGDLFSVPSQPMVPAVVISGVNDDGELELMWPWPGANVAAQPYIIRYVGITERSTRANRMALELMGEISAWADIMVEDDTARLALETSSTPLRANFRVLVKADGVIWAKATSTYGDWIGPVEFKGDQGDIGPAGPRGVTPRGDYSGATAYAMHDAVLDNGSTWVALQATAGHAPPTLPTTSNAYWQLLARKGTDGTGTGDTIGPASSVDGRFAAFSGTTGKLLKELTAAQATAVLNEAVGDSGGGGTKGLVPAPAAGDAAAGKFLKADGTWVNVPLFNPYDLETTVSMLALQVADNSNVALFLGPSGNRVADSFDALTYVDVAGAANLDSATAGILKPTIAAATSRFPTNMTSNTAPTPFVASAGTVFGGQAAYLAFDGNGATYWQNDTSTTPDSLKIDLGASGAVTVASYSISSQGAAPSNAPRDFKLQGSNDNSTFVDLDTRAGITFTGAETKTFALAAASAAYRYFRLLITANNAGTPNYLIASFQALGPVLANSLTVRSASFTAATVPAKMKALLLVKEVDAAIAGTDYTFKCGRDAGTTLATMTLTEIYTLPSGLRLVEAAETSVAGQPSGVAPRWEFKTLNNKNVELHDVYFYWS